MRAYTDLEFRKKVSSTHNWVKYINDTYTSKLESISVTCNNNHTFSAPTKSLTREHRLRECPECQRAKRESLCFYCMTPTKNAKFCSRSCSAKFNNKLRRMIRFCKECEKEITSDKKTGFCSISCKSKYEKRIKIQKWLCNPEIIKSEHIPKWLREYLLEKCNYTCEECGWNKINNHTGRIPLQIHHIDGNYMNYSNSNLKVLCPNCHSLTENYGARNTGRGRPSRYHKNKL